MIKESIQQEDTKIVNIPAANTEPSKYIKQTLLDLEGETVGFEGALDVEPLDPTLSNTIILRALTLYFHQWTVPPDKNQQI
jgi:hypothetical protein